jgi:preprotein translocase subunit SecG
MFTGLLILQVLLGVTMIGLILLQQGKGADMGAAFGAGASGTVFGAGGGGSFFSRTTAILAAVFFANSILLSSPLVRHQADPTASVTQTVPAPQTQPDMPAPETVDEGEAASLPPADLPDVPEQPPKAESDLPPE